MPARKKTAEPEINPAMFESEEPAQPAEPEQPDIPAAAELDMNELLGSMDEPPEDSDDENLGFEDFKSGSFGGPPDDTDAVLISDDIPDDSVETDPPPEESKKPARKKKEPESEISDAPSGKTAAIPARRRRADASILTIESKTEVESQKNIEEAAWHDIRNAYRTRKILTGTLGGVEKTETGKTIAVVHYNDFRVVIPMKEMMINLTRSPSGSEYDDFILRQNKILGNMLGAEIDFIVKGIESKTRSIVASRKDAMLKKREIFYMHTDASGKHRIYDGRVVQARVIAVAEKVIRVEAFGVECSIMARELSWDWLGDAHDRFSIGDEVLIRILTVKRNSLEDISITADARSVSENTNHDNLKNCRIQGKYAGTVTDVYKGVVYIRLSNGANAIAHSCYDRRRPGKKDDVSFAVTHIDEDRGVAVGIITRILKQNL